MTQFTIDVIGPRENNNYINIKNSSGNYSGAWPPNTEIYYALAYTIYNTYTIYIIKFGSIYYCI